MKKNLNPLQDGVCNPVLPFSSNLENGNECVDWITNPVQQLVASRITGLLTTFFLALSIFSTPAYAVQKIQEVNYYASFRAAETNVRAGPGQNYPIKFTYKIKGIPVRVINEYDNWNEIEDYEKQTGWVSQSLLTKKRTLMVNTTKDFINMYSKNSEKSRVVFHLENNVIGDCLKCSGDWCGIKISGKKGWVKNSDVFGGDAEESKKD